MISDNVLNILNDALEKDPVAMMALISTTVPTNSNIASSYYIKIHKGDIEFGLLSIINKIIEKENKKIIFDYDVNVEGEMLPKKFIIKFCSMSQPFCDWINFKLPANFQVLHVRSMLGILPFFQPSLVT